MARDIDVTDYVLMDADRPIIEQHYGNAFPAHEKFVEKFVETDELAYWVVKTETGYFGLLPGRKEGEEGEPHCTFLSKDNAKKIWTEKRANKTAQNLKQSGNRNVEVEKVVF